MLDRKGAGGRSINGLCKRGHAIDTVRKRCTVCRLASAARWKANNARKVRDLTLRKYGIDLVTYEAMFAAQGGLCAICRRPFAQRRAKHFHVDHDHVSGRVRGLLCAECNTALGLFSDDPSRLERGAEYLRRSVIFNP